MTPITPDLPPTMGWTPIVYAKDQPQYQPLPCVRDSSVEGRIITRWRLTWRERVQVLWRGDVWLHVLTFHRPLQPVVLETTTPTLIPHVAAPSRDAEKLA